MKKILVTGGCGFIASCLIKKLLKNKSNKILNLDALKKQSVKESLDLMRIDSEGLDDMDRKYMNCIIKNFSGGPVGIDTLSAALLEQRDIIEDVIEPYWMQKGFVQRTPRGRIITKKGMEHL